MRSFLLVLLLGGCASPPRAHRPDAPATREAPRDEGPDLADADHDGVRDAREVRLGTDPREPDRDGDGVRDGDDLAPQVPSPRARFTTTDVLASEPGAVLPDPEFDAASGQFVWQTFTGSALWVGRVDAQTGALVPRDGRGTKVDEGLGGVGVGANGPEWVTTPQGPVITYIKPARGDYEVWAARNLDGRWQAAALGGGPLGVRPYGQHAAGASVGRIIYRTRAGEGWDNVWREVGGARGAHLLPREAGVHNTRWALDDEHVLVGSAPPDYSVVRYDIRDGRRSALTTDGGVHHDPYQTTAPEWGGERVIVSLRGPAVNDYPELVVYREVRGAWTPVKVIRPPAAYPQIISPELFAWKKRPTSALWRRSGWTAR